MPPLYLAFGLLALGFAVATLVLLAFDHSWAAAVTGLIASVGFLGLVQWAVRLRLRGPS